MLFVEVDGWQRLARFFDASVRIPDDLSPVFESFIPLFAEILSGHFVSQGRTTPFGAWAPLSPRYLRSRRKRTSLFPRDILRLTGRLWLTVSPDGIGTAGNIARVSRDSMEYGVDLGEIPYARVHHFGLRRRNLPARPWLMLTQNAVAELFRRLYQHIRGNLENYLERYGEVPAHALEPEVAEYMAVLEAIESEINFEEELPF